jgi:sugar fermentation stimulation protein A
MKYDNVLKGVFLSRPNRFIAKVNIEGVIETVHVKNTGRCKELLVNGAIVYLSESDNPLRKTKYDLIAVEKILEGGKRLLINMDSQIPNFVVCEFLENSGLF